MSERNVRLANTYCPKCGKHVDATIPWVSCDSQPAKDDVSVCFYCGAISTFQEDLTLLLASDRQMSKWEREDPAGYQRLIAARRAVLVRRP